MFIIYDRMFFFIAFFFILGITGRYLRLRKGPFKICLVPAIKLNILDFSVNHHKPLYILELVQLQFWSISALAYFETVDAREVEVSKISLGQLTVRE